MFNAGKINWVDFEVFSAEDLKAAGAFRYAADASTRAIVLAYAIGDGPARTWHADGDILDWNRAPDDLHAAFDRSAPFAMWNAGFDSAIWNYATLGFPFLAPERVIDVMIQAGVANLPTDLESASRALGGEGKQKDGKALIRMFCIEGAAPRERPEEWQRFLTYARQDITAMRDDVYRKTRPLPLTEWREYWAFEHINRRGVMLDMAFVRRAAALAVEDAVASGRRLAELTCGIVTKVTQAKRIAAWLHDNLTEAAMREVITVGVPADDNDDDADEDETEFSLTRDRVARVLAMLDAKHANGGLTPEETKAREAATLRLYGAGASPLKFARLDAQQVDGVLRGQYRFAGAGQTGRMTSRGAANPESHQGCPRQGWRCGSLPGRCDRRWLQLRHASCSRAGRCAGRAQTGSYRASRHRGGRGKNIRLVGLFGDRSTHSTLAHCVTRRRAGARHLPRQRRRSVAA